jgi:hypothetical protein
MGAGARQDVRQRRAVRPRITAPIGRLVAREQVFQESTNSSHRASTRSGVWTIIRPGRSGRRRPPEPEDGQEILVASLLIAVLAATDGIRRSAGFLFVHDSS